MTVKYSDFVAALPQASAINHAEQVAVIQGGVPVRMGIDVLKGADGKEVELRKGSSAIEWRLGLGEWQALVQLLELKGDRGSKVLLQKTATHIQYRYEGEPEWVNLVALSELKGDAGEGLNPRGAWVQATYNPSDYVTYGASIWILTDSAPYASTLPPPDDASHWMEWQAPSGADGREVQMQKGETHIQWRYEGETAWVNLVAIADLQGPQGKNIELQVSATHIQWRLAGETAWVDLVALSSITGPAGAGVPTGGTVGQVLAKSAAGDFLTQWIDPPSGGGGLPAGGTAGQLLVKNSTAAGDAGWSMPSTLVQTTGAQSIAGNKTFSGNTTLQGKSTVADLKISGMVSFGSMYKHTAPASAETLDLVAGVNSQLIPMAADLAALTVRLPEWPDNAFDLMILFTKTVTSLTLVGRIAGGGTISTVVGAPAGASAGGLHLRYFDTDNAWYVVHA